jgi:monovalent cation:H+ antiporter-2, CPA2 family
VGLIFAAAGSPPQAVVRLAKQLNPSILVLARVAFMHASAELGHAGADVVIAAEAEVALAMAERLLTALGATAEQLDRERVGVRAELQSAKRAPHRWFARGRCDAFSEAAQKLLPRRLLG